MKPGKYTQLYVQLVFAVKNRDAVLNSEIRGRVSEYISGIITNLKHKSIIVNGVSDHLHILLGLNPSISISDTVYNLKRSSTLLINKEKLCKGVFAWQEGYGAFSFSKSQLELVYNYILNQEEHHRKISFKEEYLRFLDEFAIEYEPKYLFDFF
ncbi:MAG: IS200/IS605 family transposase [Tenuifilaceae bacterium]|nr:IS200/IS605 family transposase [Tenuifilaceae bacterium]